MTDRIPLGQIPTTKWPVLHYGNIPRVDTTTWTFRVSVLLERPSARIFDELLEEDLPGFWEQNGYHMRGDPWTEERYGGRGLTQHEINKFRNASKTILGS